jgi:hypothetical protein
MRATKRVCQIRNGAPPNFFNRPPAKRALPVAVIVAEDVDDELFEAIRIDDDAI